MSCKALYPSFHLLLQIPKDIDEDWEITKWSEEGMEELQALKKWNLGFRLTKREETS